MKTKRQYFFQLTKQVPTFSQPVGSIGRIYFFLTDKVLEVLGDRKNPEVCKYCPLVT